MPVENITISNRLYLIWRVWSAIEKIWESFS